MARSILCISRPRNTLHWIETILTLLGLVLLTGLTGFLVLSSDDRIPVDACAAFSRHVGEGRMFLGVLAAVLAVIMTVLVRKNGGIVMRQFPFSRCTC